MPTSSPVPLFTQRFTVAAVLALATFAPGRSSLAADAPAGAPLIARDILFGNPERAMPKISPDGKRLAWLAPDKAGVLQVWVKTIGGKDDKVVTADKRRGIRRYDWAEDDRTLLYLQDSDGDENWHTFGVDLTTGTVRDYTPWPGVRAELLDVSPDFPGRIVVTANVRDKKLFDVYRVDLRSGATELDTENPGDITGWTVDPKQAVRAGHVVLPDGGHEVRGARRRHRRVPLALQDQRRGGGGRDRLQRLRPQPLPAQLGGQRHHARGGAQPRRRRRQGGLAHGRRRRAGAVRPPAPPRGAGGGLRARAARMAGDRLVGAG